MNRPRVRDKHLPRRMYCRRGAYYYVSADGKWRQIGKDYASALHEYARIHAQPSDSFAKLIEDARRFVLEDEQGRPLAQNTVKTYTHAMSLLQTIFTEYRPADIKASDVEKMLDHYRAKPGLARHLLVVMKKVCVWAIRRDLMKFDPTAAATRYQAQKRDTLVTPAQYAAIYQQAGERLRCILDLCVITGQRVGDVISLTRRQLLADGIEFTQRKTKKRLIVAWTPELEDAVTRAKALQGSVAHPYLFPTAGGRHVEHANVWRSWRTACERAGVTGVRIHDLRAVAATTAEAQGLNAQALLGHRDRRTTAIYLRDKTVPVVQAPRKASK